MPKRRRDPVALSRDIVCLSRLSARAHALSTSAYHVLLSYVYMHTALFALSCFGLLGYSATYMSNACLLVATMVSCLCRVACAAMRKRLARLFGRIGEGDG